MRESVGKVEKKKERVTSYLLPALLIQLAVKKRQMMSSKEIMCPAKWLAVRHVGYDSAV